MFHYTYRIKKGSPVNAIVKSIGLVIAMTLSGCAATSKLAVTNSLQQPITVTKHGIYSMDSAGGVSYYIAIANTSPKTIKYVAYTARPFNRVGDEQADSISGKVDRKMQAVGPIAPGDRDSGGWGPLWYNSSISCIKLVGITVTYMDGSVEELDQQQLKAGLGTYDVCMSHV